MKKVLLLALICALAETYTYAQNVFSYNPEIKRSHTIELDHNEKLLLEFASPDMLQSPPSLDSILKNFMKDIKQYGDSVYYSVNTVRVDQVLFPDGKRQNRLRVLPTSATITMIDGDRIVPSKVDQDTIIFTGYNEDPEKEYRYTLYLNFIKSLEQYEGKFDQMIAKISPGMYQSENVVDTIPPAYVQTNPRMVMLFRPSIDIQNHRTMFVPSVTLGLVVAKTKANIYTEYSIASELHFTFGKEADGKVRTYANSFVTLSYGKGKLYNTEQVPVRLFPYVSLSYLVNNKADSYPGETFRVGFGRWFLGLNKSTKIEPALYISDFKHVSPSIRLSQML